MPPQTQQPSVGRMVHYDPGHAAHLTATIAGITDTGVNLGNILDEFGNPLDAVQNVPEGKPARTGQPSWHWPEYVGFGGSGDKGPAGEPDHGPTGVHPGA